MNPTEIRMQAAKEFANKVKKGMKGGCKDVYVFGSVVRNEAKETSDLDLILLLQKPSLQELKLWNTLEELEKRDNVYNFAKNSHKIFETKERVEKTYGFPISIYIQFEKLGRELIPLCKTQIFDFTKF